jgi:hypothetical protein
MAGLFLRVGGMLGQLMLAKNWPVSVSTILKESSNNCFVTFRHFSIFLNSAAS